MLCAAFRRETSRNGEKLSVLKSGLQKYVRRGETDKAVWCVGELFSFRDAPEQDQAKRIETNFYHRMMIIFLEDVGSIGLWSRIDALCAKARGESAAAAYRSWTELMCAHPKSRACSHARAVASLRNIEDRRVPRAFAMACQLYPAIAALHAEHKLDPRFDVEPKWRSALVEALRSRSQSAFLWAWAIETKGAQRKAEGGRKPVWQIFEALAEGCAAEIVSLIPMARRWYKELQNTQESFLCWMLPLLAQVGDHPVDDPAPALVDDSLVDDASAAQIFATQKAMKLDDYVFDIHVGSHENAGAAKGQGGLVRFVEEGSYVENESPFVDQMWKAFYNDRKRIDEWEQPLGPPAVDKSTGSLVDKSADKPTNHMTLTDADIDELVGLADEPANAALESQYEFLVRTQITTSQYKTDVYFAREPQTGKLVVVKGPFASREPVDRALEMNEWKRANGLPAAKCDAKELIPDMWLEGVPLGIRNRAPRDSPSWFLVADSLLPEDPPRRTHSSKLWPPTEVVDWEAPSIAANHLWAPMKHNYSMQVKVDYVVALLARYVMGISDLADRNFLRSGGRLYSLDEDGRVPAGRQVQLAGELRVNKATKVRAWAEELWDQISSIVAEWDAPKTSPSATERLERVKSLPNVLALFET